MKLATLLLTLLAACTGSFALRGSAPEEKSRGLAGYSEGALRDVDGMTVGHVSEMAALDGPEASGDAGAPGATPAAPSDRLVVRTGALTLRTGNPDEVGARATEFVKVAGGYLQNRSDHVFVFRIPAARFEELFAALEAMGTVVHRSVDAQDVTDEVTDLELRLKNARALRDRYEELLKRADKVEDVLAIERELAKLTETIELLEGQLKGRRDEVAMSRLTLALQAVPTGRVIAASSPFPWLGKVGVERLPQYRAERASSSRIRWELPEGFADMGRISDSDVAAWAYSPDGIRVVVRRFDHKPEADLGFWTKELRRELVKARGYEQDGEELRFRTIADGQSTTYAVRLAAKDRYLTVVELIGPADAVAARWAELAALLDRIERDAR